MGQPVAANSFWDDLCRKDSEVNRNIYGNWTRAELRQSAAGFNASRDPAERKRELVKFFSANYIRKIQIGESVYVPERFVDWEKLFLRGYRKSALHPLTCPEGRAAIFGDKIAAYNSLVAGPCLENADAFLWKRILEIPLATIEKIVLRQNRLLFIQL